MTVVVLLTSLLFITANYGEDIGDLSNANFSELSLFLVNLTFNNFVFVLRRHSKKRKNETFSSRAPSFRVVLWLRAIYGRKWSTGVEIFSIDRVKTNRMINVCRHSLNGSRSHYHFSSITHVTAIHFSLFFVEQRTLRINGRNARIIGRLADIGP